MRWEKEPSPFMRLSQHSRKAVLWLPALWISTPALLFITSTQSPYLPSTALDYREGTPSRETVKANEHGVKPVPQEWDAARRRGWAFSTSRHAFISGFPLSPVLLLLRSYSLTTWSPNIQATIKASGACRNAVLAVAPPATSARWDEGVLAQMGGVYFRKHRGCKLFWCVHALVLVFLYGYQDR